MFLYLSIEFVAQDYDVLKLIGEDRLICPSVVPNLSLSQEIEARTLHELGCRTGLVRAEKDGCAKDPFKSADQPPVFLATLMHAESVEHFTCAPKPDDRTLLLHCEGRQKNGHNAVLTERHAVVRVAGNLEHELPVATLVQELAFRQPADRQPTKHKGPGTKAERLVRLLAFDPNDLQPLAFSIVRFETISSWWVWRKIAPARSIDPRLMTPGQVPGSCLLFKVLTLWMRHIASAN
jgi:hypothetical protein